MILPAILLLTLVTPQDTPADTTDVPPATASDEAAQAPPAAAPAASPAAVQTDIDAGLAFFRKRHFKQAEVEFQKAVDADPGNAAATFYLGYTVYKIAEPHKHGDPGKRRAAELFAKAYELDPSFRPVWAGPKK